MSLDADLTAFWEFARRKTLVASYGLGPTIAIARALATATEINVSGLIVPIGANAARFDHHPVTLASLGLLIEEERENICLRNRNLENVIWALTRASVDPNTDAGPGGDSTADKLVEDSSVETSHRVRQTIGFDGASPYTFSNYSAPNGRSQVLSSF